jgi:hypothetical protein
VCRQKAFQSPPPPKKTRRAQSRSPGSPALLGTNIPSSNWLNYLCTPQHSRPNPRPLSLARKAESATPLPSGRSPHSANPPDLRPQGSATPPRDTQAQSGARSRSRSERTASSPIGLQPLPLRGRRHLITSSSNRRAPFRSKPPLQISATHSQKIFCDIYSVGHFGGPPFSWTLFFFLPSWTNRCLREGKTHRLPRTGGPGTPERVCALCRGGVPRSGLTIPASGTGQPPHLSHIARTQGTRAATHSSPPHQLKAHTHSPRCFRAHHQHTRLVSTGVKNTAIRPGASQGTRAAHSSRPHRSKVNTHAPGCSPKQAFSKDSDMTFTASDISGGHPFLGLRFSTDGEKYFSPDLNQFRQGPYRQAKQWFFNWTQGLPRPWAGPGANVSKIPLSACLVVNL